MGLYTPPGAAPGTRIRGGLLHARSDRYLFTYVIVKNYSRGSLARSAKAKRASALCAAAAAAAGHFPITSSARRPRVNYLFCPVCGMSTTLRHRMRPVAIVNHDLCAVSVLRHRGILPRFHPRMQLAPYNSSIRICFFIKAFRHDHWGEICILKLRKGE